jgi:hypothetical protein
LKLSDLLHAALHDRSQPIATDYDIYLLARPIITARHYKGLQLTRRPSDWDAAKLRIQLRQLHQRNTIAPDPDFGNHVWVVVGVAGAGSAEEACCLVDPFCCVSHLSAMQRYNLTDRSPAQLQITRPRPAQWRSLRQVRTSQDLSSTDVPEDLPSLHRISFRTIVRGRQVQVHETANVPIGKKIRGEITRITSIGRTFVDMLDEPDLCGGIRHVLDVWDEHARDHLDEIIEAVNQMPSKLLRVRAGYILEERLSISNHRILAWLEFAQRGGSSKLDAKSPYCEPFSERWMLSINV